MANYDTSYMVPIYLNPIDKIRLLATNVNSADFIGMISSHVSGKMKDGQSFYVSGDPSQRSFTYYENGGDDYIINESGDKISLSKGRSLTGVLMDKMTNNGFTKAYKDLQKTYSDAFNFTMDGE